MRRYFALALMAFVLLASGCSSPEADGEKTQQPQELQPQAEQKTADVIAMHFAWPADTRANVHFVREKTEFSSGMGHQQTIEGSYKMLTQKVPPGLLVKRLDQQATIKSGGQQLSEPDQQAQEFLARTTAISPMFVLNGEGRVAGFYNIEEFKQELIDAATDWAEDLPEANPNKQKVPVLIENLTGGNNLENNLIAVWNREIALWSGQRLQLGKSYSIEGTQKFPMLDFIEVPINLTITLHRRVPCEAVGKTLSCVEVEYAYTLEDSRLDDIEARYLAATDDGRKGLEDLRFDYSLKVTLEPDTLLPHHLLEQETQSLVLQKEGFMDREQKRIIKTETRYDYTQRMDLLNRGASPSVPVTIQ